MADIYKDRCSKDLERSGKAFDKVCIVCGFGPCQMDNNVTLFPGMKSHSEIVSDLIEHMRTVLSTEDYIDFLEGCLSASHYSKLDSDIVAICDLYFAIAL